MTSQPLPKVGDTKALVVYREVFGGHPPDIVHHYHTGVTLADDWTAVDMIPPKAVATYPIPLMEASASVVVTDILTATAKGTGINRALTPGEVIEIDETDIAGQQGTSNHVNSVVVLSMVPSTKRLLSENRNYDGTLDCRRSWPECWHYSIKSRQHSLRMSTTLDRITLTCREQPWKS